MVHPICSPIGTNTLNVAGTSVVRSIGSVGSNLPINVCQSSRGGMPILLGSNSISVASIGTLKSFSV